MRELGRRFSAGWCRTFHPRPFWPIHGHYLCPACMRTYPVPWSEGNRFNRASIAGAHEAGARASIDGIAQAFMAVRSLQ